MFRPNLKCEVAYQLGGSLTGKVSFGPWKTVPVGIVKLEHSTNKTSVRTDSSASRGSAQEILADARLLFPAGVMLKVGDRIRIQNVLLTVQSIFPRHAVTGRFDHWQVDCDIYYGKE